MRREMPEEGDTISLITRRRLLKSVGTAFLTYTIAKAGLGYEEETRVFEERRLAMGSTFRITAIGESKRRLKSAMNAAFLEIKRLEALMTIFDNYSEISRLNTNGAASLSPECIEVLEKALYFSRLTEGAFDVTLGNYPYLSVTGTGAMLKKPGVKVDLGGIGIGYAVDCGIDVLRSRGVKAALVDGGGEMKTLGCKESGLSWKVGVRDPFRKEGFTGVIRLDDMSVSTSGNYEKLHVIDPKTGAYPEGLKSATVIAMDATTADALSTGVFILGKVNGLRLLESLHGVEGLLITSNGEILRSKGFKRYALEGFK